MSVSESSIHKRFLVTHLVLFCIAVTATFVAFSLVRATVHAEEQRVFEESTAQARRWITMRMNSYFSVLRSMQSFWYGSQDITQAEWQQFVEHLGVAEEYPGLSSVIHTERVPQTQKSQVEQRMRAVPLESYDEFTIHPEKTEGDYFAVLFIYPIEGRESAIGFDQLSIPGREEAFAYARDTGKTASTKLTNLVTTEQPGFFILAPLYESYPADDASMEERRETLRGFSVLAFRSKQLFASPSNTSEDPFPFLDFEIYSGEPPVRPESLIHDHDPNISATNPLYKPAFSREDEFVLDGHSWTIVTVSKPNFNLGRFQSLLPNIILGMGSFFSLLLLLITTRQYRAYRMSLILSADSS